MTSHKSNDQIFNMLLSEDEITWQSIIYNLVKTNEIDPWNVDISELSSKFLDLLKKLKEMDFRVSGKILLAAAILLKIKSNKLIGEDMTNFDNLFKFQEESESLDEYVDSLDLNEQLLKLDGIKNEDISLIPRTPQPRERKVSIFDLVDALQRALDVKKRRVVNSTKQTKEFKIPEKVRDITEIIRDVYSNVKTYFIKNQKNSLEFSQLLSSEEKEDKIFTFLSLLHLTNERKIDLEQEQHFSPIFVKMVSK